MRENGDLLSDQEWDQLKQLSLKALAHDDVFAYGEYVFGYEPAFHHRQMVDHLLGCLRGRQSGGALEPRGAAKCQPGSARVQLADGRVIPLQDVRRGDVVVGLDERLRLTPSAVLGSYATGRKPILKIRTRGGHVARVSDVHRLRSFDGWTPASELRVGDFLAAPRSIRASGSLRLSESEAKLLAYWIAEGSRIRYYSSVEITNYDPAIINDATQAAKEMGWGVSAKYDKRAGRHVGLRFTGREPGGAGWSLARRWLMEHGLDARTCDAWGKFVPEAVFASDKHTIAIFLSRLFGCDGSISSKSSRGRDSVAVSYCTVSRRLAEDVRALLLRFEIISSLREADTRSGGYTGKAWRLEIRDAASVRRFVDEIGLFSKEERCVEALGAMRDDATNALSERLPPSWRGQLPRRRRGDGSLRRLGERIDNHYATTRAKAGRVAELLDDDALRDLASSDVWWDQIVSIEPDGDEETFDISVANVESYISDGLVSHNTTWGNTILGSYLVARNPSLRVCIASNTARQALDFSRAIRNAQENSRHVELFGYHKGEKWTDAEWILGNAGDRMKASKDVTMYAVGVGGAVISKRFDIIICDDILDEENTQTLDQREKVTTWFKKTLLPCLVPGGVVLVLGTRWAEEDLYAYMMTKPNPEKPDEGGLGWDFLVVSALTKCTTVPFGYISYWPEQWPVGPFEQQGTLLAKWRELGTDLFFCAYQNDVSGLARGNVFQKPWFQYFQVLDPGRAYTVRIGIDLASSESERADFTARCVVAEDTEGNFYVLSVYRDRRETHHEEFVLDGYNAFPSCALVIIENQQFQSTLIQSMMRNHPRVPVEGRRADVDKVTRARAVAARYEAHKVWHHASLKESDFERELLSFPKGHDDMTDALGLACDLVGGGLVFGFGRR